MFFEDVVVGQTIGPVDWRPSRVQLFRFSAVTWNAHRIHYDAEYARSEGYPDVLVQSHLHGSVLAGIAIEWGAGDAQLVRFRWENRAIVVADEQVRVTGRVAHAHRDDLGALVDLELEERNSNGDLCVPAWATLRLPLRADSAS